MLAVIKKEEREVTTLTGMFDIDDGITTSNTTKEEENNEKSSNKYFDYIDNKILQNEESTIVFEDNSLTSTTDKK